MSIPFEELRVLILEDNAIASKILQRYVERLGCDFIATEDPLEAIEKNKARSFDLAFVDLRNPVMDGMEVAKQLRLQSPSLRLVAVTAFVESFTREQCLQAGFHELLLKPLSIEQIESSLGALFQHEWQISDEEVAEIMAYFDNDLEFLEKNYQIMVNKLGGKVSALDTAIQEQDFEAIAHHAHNIKNSLLYFGKSEALKSITEIEMAARKKENINFHYPLNHFKSKLDDIGKKVAALHRKLSKSA